MTVASLCNRKACFFRWRNDMTLIAGNKKGMLLYMM